MTLQPVQFGALTRRQERMVAQNLPGWSATDVFSTGRLPGGEILDFMEEEGSRILDGQRLSEDSFVPSEDFMAAEADLTSVYADVGGEDDRPLAIIDRASAGSTLKRQNAGRVLSEIRNSRAYVVSDRLIQLLIRAIRNGEPV